MGDRIKIQNWVKRKSEIYCRTRKSSASPAVTSGPEMTLDQTLDSGPELSGFVLGACVFRLLCQKLTGYRLFLEWGLTLGQALFSWVKLSERGYKPRNASQKTFQHLGQKFFSPDVIWVEKNNIYNKNVLLSSSLDMLLTDDARPKCHFHSFMFPIPSILQ